MLRRKRKSCDSTDEYVSSAESAEEKSPSVLQNQNKENEVSQFAVYVFKEPQNRGKSPSTAIKEVTEFCKALEIALIDVKRNISTLETNIDIVTSFIREESKIYKPESLRKQLMRHISLFDALLEYWVSERKRIEGNKDRVNKFLHFLEQQEEENTWVKTQDFLGQLPMEPMQTNIPQYFLQQIPAINLPDSSKFEEQDVFYRKDTLESKMILRLRQCFSDIGVNDVGYIISGLSRHGADVLDAEEVFFEESWKLKNYPWTTGYFVILPDLPNILPKVFNPPFISDKYLLMPFCELSKSDWPLKKAVEKLKTIIFEINPFKIGRTFWDVINLTAKCIEELCPNEKNIVLDFDQLFSLLIIETLATAYPDILHPMMYAASFRDSQHYDAHTMYAMGHMEGLVTLFKTIDIRDLEAKTLAILNGAPPPE